MKNKIFKLFSTLIISLVAILPITVKAANAKIDINASAYQVTVGSTVTVTIRVSGSSALGTYEYSLDYDKTKLMLTSGDIYNVGYPSTSNTKSYTKTFKFKVIASGSSTISVKSYSVLDYKSEKDCAITVSKASIKGITQEELEATYSDNNYLQNLKIEGFNLNPVFNKNTLEYKVTLNPNIENINITAIKEDTTAKVTGAGVVKVSEGENKIIITVTSQKGSKRVYTILATVVDQNPINVNINDEEYTVVKKESSLKIPETYTPTKVSINDVEVPGFYSEITHYTLVGLKDKDGNVELYIYNFEDRTYELYNEIKFGSIVFNPLKALEIPKNYEETEMLIGDQKVIGYKIETASKYALIYGMNIETGEKNWYRYEETENTLQIYTDEELSISDEKLERYKLGIYALSAGFVILALLLITVTSLKTNKKKKALPQKKEESQIDTKIEEKLSSTKEIKSKEDLKEISEENEQEIKEIPQIKEDLKKDETSIIEEKKKKEKPKKIDKIFDEW